jgi:hypothetical protein
MENKKRKRQELVSCSDSKFSSSEESNAMQRTFQRLAMLCETQEEEMGLGTESVVVCGSLI